MSLSSNIITIEMPMNGYKGTNACTVTQPCLVLVILEVNIRKLVCDHFGEDIDVKITL